MATTQQPVISVRGEATIEAEPEVAVVSVTVQARGRDRPTVLDLLATRNAQTLTLVKNYGEAVEKVESGVVTVFPDIKDKARGERVLRYLAQATARVTVRDFTVLGELVTRLADGDLVTVAGPWWSLRPDSPVYRQARIAAAQDATRRAEEYAAAFNGRLGQLIEAADTGLLAGPGEPPVRTRGFAAMSARGMPGADEQAVLDFEPAKQPVTAHVDARFYLALDPPSQASDHP
jgi:uncharacterized protein YggE